jgi:hypothetical protein
MIRMSENISGEAIALRNWQVPRMRRIFAILGKNHAAMTTSGWCWRRLTVKVAGEENDNTELHHGETDKEKD